jgi:plastocyanin
MWVAVGSCVALAACSDDPSGPSPTGAVEVRDFAFAPEDIVVASGATVTWTWTGAQEHTIDFDLASITDSPTQASGTHTATMPTAAGTYTYHCSEHPLVMTGSIEVQP